MADPLKVDDSIAGLLDGWDTPSPREDFVDRVTARVRSGSVASRSQRRGRALAFVLGAMSATLVMALAIAIGRSSPSSLERSTHVQVPGVADVVGEPGARLTWQRRADGELVVEVVQGVAWVRRVQGGPQVSIVAGGDEDELGHACGRVEVTRQWLSVDATVDDADCGDVEAAIERARAELSD